MYISTNFKETIPYLYDQQSKDNPIVYARYKSDTDWSWLVLEYSKNQQLFYGMILPEEEITYFTVQDLEKAARDYGVDVELDTDFKATVLSNMMN